MWVIWYYVFYDIICKFVGKICKIWIGEVIFYVIGCCCRMWNLLVFFVVENKKSNNSNYKVCKNFYIYILGDD